MTPQQIKHALATVDAMLEKADAQQGLDYETSQAIGALIIAVSNLREIVNEMFVSKIVEEIAMTTRTCKYGNEYTGWRCNCSKCKTARDKRNASARKSRARHSGGGGRMRRYSASSFQWSTEPASIGPIYPDACPKQENKEK